MLRGLDVSSVQGHVDWPAVAADGCRFAIVKCSEGNRSFPDPNFQTNVDGARASGLYVAAYHFAYPLPTDLGHALRDPEGQAQRAFSFAGGLGSNPGDLPPVLDLEWPPPEQWDTWKCTAAQIRAWGLAYLAKAAALWGRTPIVYTYPDFWSHIAGAGELAFAQYPLWIASYPKPHQWPSDGDQPSVLPKPWDAWTFWQFTGGGMTLPAGPAVDYDVFNGDESALQQLAGV